MEKSGKVKSINDEIKKLEKLRSEIQNECSHKETYVKFTESGNTPKLICCLCEKEVGYPSQKKLDYFLQTKSK